MPSPVGIARDRPDVDSGQGGKSETVHQIPHQQRAAVGAQPLWPRLDPDRSVEFCRKQRTLCFTHGVCGCDCAQELASIPVSYCSAGTCAMGFLYHHYSPITTPGEYDGLNS